MTRLDAEVDQAKRAMSRAGPPADRRRALTGSVARAAAGARTDIGLCSEEPVLSRRPVAVTVAGAAARDRLSFLALLPLMCAVHCVVTPVLVAFVPALGVPTSAEWCLVAVSVVVAIFALRRGARSKWNGVVRAIACSGVAIWDLSLLGFFEPLPERLTSPVGGLVLAAALFWNGRLRHRDECSDCGCPMH